MGRQIRRVPMYWTMEHHPKDGVYPYGGGPRYQPMFDQTLAEAQVQWDEEVNDPDNRRLYEKYGDPSMTFDEYLHEEYGERPEEGDGGPYHPDWPEDAQMGIQLWENTTEGTPKTDPYPDTPEGRRALCEYAAKHVSVFADQKVSAEDWHRMLFDEGFVYHREGNAIFT